MKILIALAALSFTTNSNAESLSFPTFKLEVEDGWLHVPEVNPDARDETGQLVRIDNPHGTGVLKIQTYRAPGPVGKENLRNFTNVDSTTPLAWQDWGSNSGYQHDYSEKGSFFRQWWLVNDKTIVLIVYSSTTEHTDAEMGELTSMVNSLKVNSP